MSLAFDDLVVLDDLSFSLPKGAMRILLGESGSGKSVVLKLILGLLRPDAGTTVVNGHRVDRLAEPDLLRMRETIGTLFQEDLDRPLSSPFRRCQLWRSRVSRSRGSTAPAKKADNAKLTTVTTGLRETRR